MVISLYICEIPRNVDKSDIEDLFKSMDGYLETRIKGANDMRKIAFVDFKEHSEAVFAMETLQGFKFSPSDKGLIIKISDNTKGGGAQSKLKKSHGASSSRQRQDSVERSKLRSRSRYKDRKDEDSRDGSRASFSRSRSRSRRNSESRSNNGDTQNQPQANPNILPSNANTNILDLLSLLNSGGAQGSNPTTNKPYTMSEPQTEASANPLTNLFDVLQNLQTVQLLSSLNNPQPKETSSLPAVASTNVISSSPSSEFCSSLLKFDDYFQSAMDFKRNATNIVYVEGLPYDVSEREVSHLFRPFPGFRSVRLISRDKNGQKSLICFADFEDIVQSTVCINTLQGYRFDKNDLVGLHFSYGVNKHKDKK